MVEVWVESKYEVGDEEKDKAYRNKILIFYPSEMRDIIDDVLDTLERKNIADFGSIDEELLNSMVWVLTYALSEKEQTKRLKDPEVIELHVLNKERSKSLFKLAGTMTNTLKYEVYIYGEKWDLLTREQRIQAIIHELLHFNPEKPDTFKKHDRFDREYQLMEKYLEAKSEQVAKKQEIVAIAQLKKKKKPIEEEMR